MRAIIFCLGVMMSATPVWADTVDYRPIRTVTWLISGVSCTDQDEYANFLNDPPGAGILPPAGSPMVLVGYALKAGFMSPQSYALIGKTQPYGDYITSVVGGSGPHDTGLVFYPSRMAFPMTMPRLPVQGGDGQDQLHLHYDCAVSDQTSGANWFQVTLVYDLIGDPTVIAGSP